MSDRCPHPTAIKGSRCDTQRVDEAVGRVLLAGDGEQSGVDFLPFRALLHARRGGVQSVPELFAGLLHVLRISGSLYTDAEQVAFAPHQWLAAIH